MKAVLRPLGHELELDNPDDVDWLLKWAQAAEKKIQELEAELAALKDAMTKARQEIESDERYHYEPALVEINAPLALIQTSMEAKIQLLNFLHKLTFLKAEPSSSLPAKF